MITPDDLENFVDKLPLKKKATPAQMLLLLAGIAFVFGFGIYAGLWAKNYFDQSHSEVMAAINRVDIDSSGKIAVVVTATDKNAAAIESLRHYYWSNADMQRWSSELDHVNRNTVPAMIVPRVPEPAPGVH